MKLNVVNSLSLIALGLSAQAVLRPPSPISFLQNETTAYAVLGVSILGAVFTTIKILPLLKEKAMLSHQDKDS
jgi:hypothetical protein